MTISPHRIEFDHPTRRSWFREFADHGRGARFWKKEQPKLSGMAAEGYTIRLYLDGAIVDTLTPEPDRASAA